MWNIIFWALVIMKAYQWFTYYKLLDIKRPNELAKYVKSDFFTVLTAYKERGYPDLDPTIYLVIDNRNKKEDDYFTTYIYFGFISFFIYRIWYTFIFDEDT